MAYIVEHEAARTPTGDFLPCGKGDLHLEKPSIGLVQISMIYHPDVPQNLAVNAQWSLEWLASRLREGKCYWWTTCREWLKKWPVKEGVDIIRNN